MGSTSTPSLSIRGLNIQDEVGRGAHSRVFRASRGVDTVAVKVPRADADTFDDEAIRRFQREGSILACLTHPALPHVFEVGVADGLPYIVLEYIEGDSLDQLLENGPLSRESLLEHGRALSGVLAELHSQGLVHCDVTPRNILIDPNGESRLVDFGLAYGWAASEDDSNGAPIGTVQYASPEQTGMIDRPVDGRSDLYELGAVLFHCATGQPPFRADDRRELKHRHATASVPDPREARPELPERLARLIEQLLAKEPTDRPANAERVLTEFHRCETGDITTAGQFLDAATRTVSATDDKLVGRQQHLDRLRQIWDEAKSGAGRAAMVLGSAGSGKTALTDALLGEVQNDGALVLQVEGLVEEPYPYAPVRRMLEPLISYADTLDASGREIARRTLDEAMGEYASVLQPILPELAGGETRPEDLPETADSEQVYRGLASMLISLAEQAGGGLLVVDDAHQLDDATREVLERVAIDSEQTPLMLVAVCDEQAPPERLDTLADSLSEMLETRLELGPLPPDALEELIRNQLADRPVDMRLIERITTLSNGNPYAAAAYVRAVLDAAVLRPTWNGWEVDEAALETLELPEELSALLVERLERLSERAVEVIGWISVFSTSVDLDRLAACVDLDRPALQRAIGEAHRHRLIDIDKSGDYTLVHDEVRQGALERLDDEQLRDRHQRAAEVLDDGNDDPDRLYRMAHHYGRGRVAANPRRAFELNYKAALLAADRLAYERAFEFVDRACQIAEAYDLETDADFHGTVGDIADRTSRLQTAERHLDRAIEAADDPLRCAELHCQLANVFLGAYDMPRARQTVREGFQVIDEPFPRVTVGDLTQTIANWLVGEWHTAFADRQTPRDDRKLEVRFLLYKVAQRTAYFEMDKAVLAQTGVRMLRIAQKLGDRNRLAEAHASHAILLTVLGLHERGISHMQRALEIADDSGDPYLVNSVKMYDWLISEFRGDPRRAERLIREVFCRDNVMLESFEHVTGFNTLIHHFNLRGQFRESFVNTERPRKLLEARFGKQSRHLAVMYGNLLATHTVLGRDEHLERFESVADKHAPDDSDPFRLAYYLQAKLVTRVERGQWGGETEKLVERHRAMDIPPDALQYYQGYFFVYLCYLRLHQIEHEVVDPEPGLERFDRALDDLEAVADTEVYEAYLTAFRAARLRLDDDPEAADRRLRRARQLADRYDMPTVSYEVARQRALMMHQQDRPAARDRYLRNALQIASERGWETHLDRLRRQFTGLLDVSDSRSPLETSSGTAATSLSTSWLEEQADTLQAVDQIVSNYGETEHQLEEILHELLQLFGAERARLYSVDSERGLLLQTAAHVDRAEQIDPDDDEIRSIAEQVYHTQKPVVAPASEQLDDPPDENIRSMLAIPVRLRGRIAGILYLDSRLADGVFRREDRQFLHLVAHQLLLLLQTSRVVELRQRIAHAEKRSAALLEHATRAVEIGVATMEPDESLARVSPTVHKMVDAWPTTTVWWERALEELDWPDPQTCGECGEPEYVGAVRADLTTPAGDEGDGERRVFEITSTGHGHELTETSGEHVLLVRNITEQFETNEQLKRMNRELKKARDQAMAASEAKSKFLARMSHEFRTPLNAVLGYTELLLENVDNLDPEQMASDLQHIQTSAEQLHRLIGDVLDLTKIDSGRLELEPTSVDLPEVVDEVTATLQPMLEESGNELVVELDELPFDLQTDETKLRQLLLNLLRNAAKFTDDGTITLSAEPAGDEEYRRVAFEVADTGIGMTEQEQAEIFEPFFQADESSTSEYRGTGLGLTLVQRFAERMGGRIEVDSTPGEGTTFRLELPANPDFAATDDEEAAAETSRV